MNRARIYVRRAAICLLAMAAAVFMLFGMARLALGFMEGPKYTEAEVFYAAHTAVWKNIDSLRKEVADDFAKDWGGEREDLLEGITPDSNSALHALCREVQSLKRGSMRWRGQSSWSANRYFRRIVYGTKRIEVFYGSRTQIARIVFYSQVDDMSKLPNVHWIAEGIGVVYGTGHEHDDPELCRFKDAIL